MIPSFNILVSYLKKAGFTFYGSDLHGYYFFCMRDGVAYHIFHDAAKDGSGYRASMISYFSSIAIPDETTLKLVASKSTSDDGDVIFNFVNQDTRQQFNIGAKVSAAGWGIVSEDEFGVYSTCILSQQVTRDFGARNRASYHGLVEVGAGMVFICKATGLGQKLKGTNLCEEFHSSAKSRLQENGQVVLVGEVQYLDFNLNLLGVATRSELINSAYNVRYYEYNPDKRFLTLLSHDQVRRMLTSQNIQAA